MADTRFSTQLSTKVVGIKFCKEPVSKELRELNVRGILSKIFARNKCHDGRCECEELCKQVVIP